MLLFRKPSDAFIRQFLAEQSQFDFSYNHVGDSFGDLPAGFVVDRTRVKLGQGETTFLAARKALAHWDQFRLNWVEARPETTPIRQGEMVAVLAKAICLWWLNACRIIQVIDQPGEVARFGFAYGTLPDHAATGEERFLVEWNRLDDSVWFDILAFSKPRHPLVKLGYPVVRLTQKRFGREATESLLKSIRQQIPQG